MAIYDFTRCVKPSGKAYGTAGTCRKGVEEEGAVYTPAGSIRGRIPRNNPKEVLTSGLTPLEKAEAKLKQFESKINRPSVLPSESEMLQYGKLKNAIDDFKTKIEGRQISKGLFGRKVEDKSDLDDSKLRAGGQLMRLMFAKAAGREILNNNLKATQAVAQLKPLLRTRGKLAAKDLLLLKEVRKTLKDSLKKQTAYVQANRQVFSGKTQKEVHAYFDVMQKLNRNLQYAEDKIVARIEAHGRAVKKATATS
jgi:hypothetical protein